MNKQTDSTPLDRYIGLDEAMRAAGVGRTSLYQMEERGEFPKRRKISKGRIGWLESEIREWLATREPVAA